MTHSSTKQATKEPLYFISRVQMAMASSLEVRAVDNEQRQPMSEIEKAEKPESTSVTVESVRSSN